VIGGFEGTVPVGRETLTSAGLTDAFIVKLDNEGEVIWAERIGGTGSESGTGVAVGAGGQICLYGWFTGEMELEGAVVTSSGKADLFIAKMIDLEHSELRDEERSGN